jgi:hypothetical protein
MSGEDGIDIAIVPRAHQAIPEAVGDALADFLGVITEEREEFSESCLGVHCRQGACVHGSARRVNSPPRL